MPLPRTPSKDINSAGPSPELSELVVTLGVRIITNTKYTSSVKAYKVSVESATKTMILLALLTTVPR